ncbi:MAG: helix-turn-helix domain-containing protein [Dehalococcoidia bacterium]|nr:helix-turn-helix domain-containing protein [Dehalococcoidia bacterium]
MTEIELNGSYLSSLDAAKILNISSSSIRPLLRTGRIPARKIANRWLIPKDNLDNFAKTYVPARGRPRKIG